MPRTSRYTFHWPAILLLSNLWQNGIKIINQSLEDLKFYIASMGIVCMAAQKSYPVVEYAYLIHALAPASSVLAGMYYQLAKFQL